MHPAVVRRLVFPLHERMKGKATHAKLAELGRTQWLTPGGLRDLQLERAHRRGGSGRARAEILLVSLGKVGIGLIRAALKAERDIRVEDRHRLVEISSIVGLQPTPEC